MLVHLTYWSKAIKHFEQDEIDYLHRRAYEFNRKNAITGCLLLINGFFVQTVEGHTDVVNELYARIMADPRHHSLRLLQYNQIIKRIFSDWLFVARVDEEDYSHVLLSFSSKKPFSFDDITAPAVDQMINEMYHTAKLSMGEIDPTKE